MSSLRATAIGNLGQDSELRMLQDGSPVLSFSVATSPYAKRSEQKQTVWVRCSLFGKRGESLQQYLVKGQQVSVFGDLTLQTFTGRDGTVRTSLELRVSELDLLGSRQDGQRQQASDDDADDLDSTPF